MKGRYLPSPCTPYERRKTSGFGQHILVQHRELRDGGCLTSALLVQDHNFPRRPSQLRNIMNALSCQNSFQRSASGSLSRKTMGLSSPGLGARWAEAEHCVHLWYPAQLSHRPGTERRSQPEER